MSRSSWTSGPRPARPIDRAGSTLPTDPIRGESNDDVSIDDLASSRAVITNGGFSLIRESVYLKKPILSFPLKGQFEQWVNGAQVERMGYGRFFPSFSPDAVKAFLYDLDVFQESVNGYTQDGNKRTLEAVDRFLEEVKAGRVSTLDDEETPQ